MNRKIIELPSNNLELEKYITSNKKKLILGVTKAFKECYRKKLDRVEVFRFKEENFCVIIEKDEILMNLNMMYEYLISNEEYEFCKTVSSCLEYIENVISNEESKQKKTKNTKDTGK